MPSIATAGRTSFPPFCYNQAAEKNAMNAVNPLFQAFSPIPVWGSTNGDCIKDGQKIERHDGIPGIPPKDFIFFDNLKENEHMT